MLTDRAEHAEAHTAGGMVLRVGAPDSTEQCLDFKARSQASRYGHRTDRSAAQPSVHLDQAGLPFSRWPAGRASP